MTSSPKYFGAASFAPKHREPATVEERLRALEDHQDIERLMSLYCLCNDGGWEGQGPSHMGPSEDLFTEDGIWEGALGRGEGRANIRALFDTLRVVRYVSHNVTNPVIDVDGDTARANWHQIVLWKNPNEAGTVENDAHWTLGNYHMELRRTKDGWRISRMTSVGGLSLPHRGYNPAPGLAG